MCKHVEVKNTSVKSKLKSDQTKVWGKAGIGVWIKHAFTQEL